MKLTAKVTGDHRRDGNLVIDGDTEGGGYFFKLPNREGFKRDDELVLLVMTKSGAALLYHDILTVDAATSAGLVYPDLADLRDQLRPDEPPIDESALERAMADTAHLDVEV